jgi:lipid A 3-O-deacylase
MRLILTILILVVFFTADTNIRFADEISLQIKALQTSKSDSIFVMPVKRDTSKISQINPHKSIDTLPKVFRIENIGQMRLNGFAPLPESLDDTSKIIYAEPLFFNKDLLKMPSHVFNKYFFIHFENDIFAETDFYFTNGAEIGFVSPYFERLFLPGKLPSAGKDALNHQGISLRQNMYTPINPENETINHNDRPFSGILIFDFFKISVSSVKKLRLSTSVQIGLIGPASLASSLQYYLHELKPEGWKHQISNDLLLNINAHVEKVILRNPYTELSVSGTAKLGSYQTNIGSGLSFRTGLLPSSLHPIAPSISYSTNNFVPKSGLPIWFFVDIRGKRIFHDASLNGGLFNKNSPYTISYANTKKYTFELSTGISAAYRSSIIAIKLVYLSPEFNKGTNHRWGAISIMHNF